MSTSLKRLVEILVVGVALSLAIMALLPGTADAQPGVAQPSSIDEESAVPATTQPVVVSEPPAQQTVTVRPGDCLWSISQQRLGPGASPQQIALEVQQIYELNRDRIGADPNLIFAGQEFLVPPPAPEPAPSQQQPATMRWQSSAPPEIQQPPTTGASVGPAAWEEGSVTSEQPAPSEVTALTEELAPTEAPSTPQPPVSEPAPTQQQASEPATPEQAPQPFIGQRTPSNNSAPTEDEQATPSLLGGIVDPLVEFYDNHIGERRLLGLGILALTALVAILMARKLPLKRDVDDPTVAGGTLRESPEDRTPATEAVEEKETALGVSKSPDPSKGPSDPSAAEGANKPHSDGELPEPSLPTQQRQERLRRIRQRTVRQGGPRPPAS